MIFALQKTAGFKSQFFASLFREVVWDDDLDRPYDALLSKVNVTYGYYGMFNFYKLQVWALLFYMRKRSIYCDIVDAIFLYFNIVNVIFFILT